MELVPLVKLPSNGSFSFSSAPVPDDRLACCCSQDVRLIIISILSEIQSAPSDFQVVITSPISQEIQDPEVDRGVLEFQIPVDNLPAAVAQGEWNVTFTYPEELEEETVDIFLSFLPQNCNVDR